MSIRFFIRNYFLGVAIIFKMYYTLNVVIILMSIVGFFIK